MITVYHGTTPDRAKKINENHVIRVTTNETKRYDHTKGGVVYVTKNLCDAMDFSTRPEKGLRERCIVVFRIRISESELKTDVDEKKWKSTLTYNGYENCYCISRDLYFGKDVDAIFVKDFFQDNERLGNYLQQVQFGEIQVMESDWKKLENNSASIASVKME